MARGGIVLWPKVWETWSEVLSWCWMSMTHTAMSPGLAVLHVPSMEKIIFAFLERMKGNYFKALR